MMWSVNPGVFIICMSRLARAFTRQRLRAMDSSAGVVIEVLQRAASQNNDILKPAQQQLHDWEKEPGFYTVLMVWFFNLVYYCRYFNAMMTVHLLLYWSLN